MDCFRRFGVIAFALLVLCSASCSRAPYPPNIALTYAAPAYDCLLRTGCDPQRPYVRAVVENGGRVVPISQTRTAEQVALLLDGVDGVLLPGGIDVDPKFYGEGRHEKLEKTDAALDRLEIAVLDWAAARALPVFAVCRGHQLLNVYCGGSLVQDIPTEFRSDRPVVHRFPGESPEPREHAISIERGTILYDLMGVERIVVNTCHHQAAERLARGFRVSARSDDGSVEAIELEARRYVLGVQFHPEKLRPNDTRFNVFFERLVQEARKRMRRSD